MLILPRHIADALVEQARREAPVEACGYLAGINELVLKCHEMTNIDKSEEHFSLDPAEQFAVLKQAREEKMDILAVYHSHPASPARPSEEDKDLAYDPALVYVIVSLSGEAPDIKAFRIRERQVEPVTIKVVDHEQL